MIKQDHPLEQLERQALEAWKDNPTVSRGLQRRIREFNESGWVQAEKAYRTLLNVVIRAAKEETRQHRRRNAH